MTDLNENSEKSELSINKQKVMVFSLIHNPIYNSKKREWIMLRTEPIYDET